MHWNNQIRTRNGFLIHQEENDPDERYGYVKTSVFRILGNGRIVKTGGVGQEWLPPRGDEMTERMLMLHGFTFFAGRNTDSFESSRAFKKRRGSRSKAGR